MRSIWGTLPDSFSQIFTKLDYLLHETGLGLRRGGWMNWAAISTVTVLLFLFGISLQVSWQMEGLLNQVGSQFEVSVYLQPGVQATTLRPAILKLPEVAEVEVISKDQAWKELLTDLGAADIVGAAAGLEENPLVDELKVKAHTSAKVPELAQQLAQIQGIDAVQYLNEALKNLAQLNRGLSQISFTVVSLLTLTAIAVITTTIRLIVMARRHEIEVMQLVGATTTWIYLPFILQGLTFGLAGAAIAWSFMTVIQTSVHQLLAQQPNFLPFLVQSLQLSSGQLIWLPLILLGFGSLVGLVGSLFAVRRFAFR
jgi:cell division transport system permease protein